MAEDHTDRRRSGGRPGPFSQGASLGSQPAAGSGVGADLAAESFTLDSYGAVSQYGPADSYPSGNPPDSCGPPGHQGRHAWYPPSGPQDPADADQLPEFSDPGWYGPPDYSSEPASWAAQAAAPTAGPGDFPPRPAPGLVLPGRRSAPARGWRRAIFQATGGVLRVRPAAADVRRRDLISRARGPVIGGHHRVVVMSLKGGVGKTTTTFALGSMLASLRGDRVIAVDANPDRGTLSDKVVLETAATIRDLLNERGQIRRYADMRAFTSQSSSRLEVLASDQDPAVSVAFGADDYTVVCQILENYYSICLTDCGTGLLHSAMTEVLRLADQIVLASTPAIDSARSASATLDWLTAHDYGDLARNAVMVLSAVRPRSRSNVSLDLLEEHFSARCRAVVMVPYDVRLDEGAEVELDQLGRATADAFLELAALVADGFTTPREPDRSF